MMKRPARNVSASIELEYRAKLNYALFALPIPLRTCHDWRRMALGITGDSFAIHLIFGTDVMTVRANREGKALRIRCRFRRNLKWG
jgi:hypothetical protein